MSPRNAFAVCCSTVGTFAFHPNRPSSSLPVTLFHTVLTRPETPSSFESSGSAAARTLRSGMASSRPIPIVGGATLGEIWRSAGNGPYAGSTIE